jgi:hypothetical protein
LPNIVAAQNDLIWTVNALIDDKLMPAQIGGSRSLEVTVRKVPTTVVVVRPGCPSGGCGRQTELLPASVAYLAAPAT